MDNKQNIDDQANKITKYCIACNKSTEIIDVDNNNGIDDNNKSNLVFASKNVPKIIDAETESINSFEGVSVFFPVFSGIQGINTGIS